MLEKNKIEGEEKLFLTAMRMHTFVCITAYGLIVLRRRRKLAFNCMRCFFVSTGCQLGNLFTILLKSYFLDLLKVLFVLIWFFLGL